tara:strand:- start:64 stop:558 length:495 start_codon:yes stop_codon:yes gene_type:complete
MESNNLVDIPNYDNYKLDLDLEQVYNSKKNKYLKNTLNNVGYLRVRLYNKCKGTTFGIHQLVYICNNPTEDIIGYDIDHIDMVKTNNKIENLRKATRSESKTNNKTRIDNKLGLKNIIKSESGYRFQLVKNGIKYNKRFKTLEETIEYRNIKVKEICGEFANLG